MRVRANENRGKWWVGRPSNKALYTAPIRAFVSFDLGDTNIKTNISRALAGAPPPGGYRAGAGQSSSCFVCIASRKFFRKFSVARICCS